LAPFSGNWFQRAAARRKAASQAYRGMLAQALAPVHYLAGGVPDTFEGRARMVTVLASLACVRWSLIPGKDTAWLVQRLGSLVLDGFDAAYREKGVGDASIARKVRKLAEGHTGLGKALFAAFSAPDSVAELTDVLRRNGVVAAGREGDMAALLLRLQADQARQPDEEILEGRFDWGAIAPLQG